MKKVRSKKRTFKSFLKRKMKSGSFREAFEHYRGALAVGMQIRELRKEAGLSQAELAHKLGISQQVISRLESGDADNPTIGTLQRIAEMTGHRLKLEFEPAARHGAA